MPVGDPDHREAEGAASGRREGQQPQTTRTLAAEHEAAKQRNVSGGERKLPRPPGQGAG